MALRHRVPDFTPSLDRPADMDKVIPRFPKATSVEFRRGGDLTGVVEAMSACKAVAVEAAVGAGKSTVLPYQVAKQMGVLVIQVFPNPFLAADISAYCSAKGEQSWFMENPADDFPDSGVVCVSAGVLVARWLEVGSTALPKCVVFHDESHEPDVFTYVVKNIAVATRNVKCYVTATATSSGAGFRRMETDGNVQDQLYPAELFRAEWDVYADAPWGVETLEGHMLIFEDSKSKAEDLAQQYRLAGMMVHRLHARMTIDEFRMAMELVRDPASPLTVLIADHSFRSGITAPFSRIVDTALVNSVTVKDGRPVRNVRYAYEAECYQARGRGGRLGGLVTKYYRPDVELQPYVNDLEAADVDAAVLIFRLLGYSVPPTLAKSASSSMDMVPRMLVGALRGAMPLACLQDIQKQPLEDFYTPSGRRSPYLKDEFEFNRKSADVMDHQVSSDVAFKHGLGSIRRVDMPVPDLAAAWENQQRERESFIDRSDSGFARAVRHDEDAVAVPEPLRASRHDGQEDGRYDHQERMEKVADTIRAFTMHNDIVDSMDIGVYYYASGLLTSNSVSSAFPMGYQSVAKWLTADLSESAHLGLSDRDRAVALNALLIRYNAKTCEMRVLSQAIPEAKTRAVGKDLGALRVWATRMSETVLAIVAELRVISRYVLRLARNFCGLEEMSPLVDSERNGREKVMRGVDALPSAGVGPPDNFMQELRGHWKELPDGYAQTVSSGSDGSMGMLDVPMPTTGRGMRAIGGFGSSELSVRGQNRGSAEYSIRKNGRKLSLVRRTT